MGSKFTSPIPLFVVNAGEMYLENYSHTLGQYKKNIDIKTHYISK